MKHAQSTFPPEFDGARRLGARLCFEALKDRAFEAGHLAHAMDAIAELSVMPSPDGDAMHLAIQVNADEAVDEGFMSRVTASPESLSLFMFALSGSSDAAVV